MTQNNTNNRFDRPKQNKGTKPPFVLEGKISIQTPSFLHSIHTHTHTHNNSNFNATYANKKLLESSIRGGSTRLASFISEFFLKLVQTKIDQHSRKRNPFDLGRERPFRVLATSNRTILRGKNKSASFHCFNLCSSLLKSIFSNESKGIVPSSMEKKGVVSQAGKVFLSFLSFPFFFR